MDITLEQYEELLLNIVSDITTIDISIETGKVIVKSNKFFPGWKLKSFDTQTNQSCYEISSSYSYPEMLDWYNGKTSLGISLTIGGILKFDKSSYEYSFDEFVECLNKLSQHFYEARLNFLRDNPDFEETFFRLSAKKKNILMTTENPENKNVIAQIFPGTFLYY